MMPKVYKATSPFPETKVRQSKKADRQKERALICLNCTKKSCATGGCELFRRRKKTEK